MKLCKHGARFGRGFFAPLLAGLLATSSAAPARALVGPSSEATALAPYVVMVLQREGARAGFCSGVVVAQDAVLTAAHCAAAGAALRVHFRDAAGKPVLLPVAAVERHPGFRPDAILSRVRSIDLALIRLAEPLPAPFRAAELASEPGPSGLGTPFRIAGFGVTQEGKGASSGRLRLGTIVARAPLSDLLLWAADPHGTGTGACEGDSGGPVFNAAAPQVVAITLWAAGRGAAHCGLLTQALWLAPQRPWIAAILQRWAKS